MVQLKNKIEVLGHFSTFIFRGIGFEVVRREVDEQSHIVELYDKDSKKTIFVTITHLQSDDYIYTTSVKGNEQNNVSCVLTYNAFFKDLKLPISDDKLDAYYNDYKGDWTKTFPGAILHKVGDFSYLDSKLDSDNDTGLNPTQRFYYDVIIPSFNKHKNNPEKIELSEEDQIRLVREIKLKICGIPIFPDNYDGESRGSQLKTAQKLNEQKIKEQKGAGLKANESNLDLPKFDDEYELLRNKPINQPFNTVIPSIGDNDVNPLGIKYPSMKPYLDPLAQPQSSGFNGMIPDRTHPLFSGGLNQPGVNRGDHPSGARYDDPTLGDESVELGLPGGSFRGTPFGRSSTGFGNGGSFGGPFGGNIF